MEILSGSRNALIVLHEIYGINEFIEMACLQYQKMGFDVFCPDLLGREPFSYSATADAYTFFKNQAGPDAVEKVSRLVSRLKIKYEKVFLLGFSAGAAVAWRCCENAECSGIIGCYGSRIRDHLNLQPVCPVLLIFADHDSFDVERVISRLQEKENIEIDRFAAEHGFMDPYGGHFKPDHAEAAHGHIQCFISKRIQ